MRRIRGTALPQFSSNGIPGAGNLSDVELREISQSPLNVLGRKGFPAMQWLHSYVTGDKVYGVSRSSRGGGQGTRTNGMLPL